MFLQDRLAHLDSQLLERGERSLPDVVDVAPLDHAAVFPGYVRRGGGIAQQFPERRDVRFGFEVLQRNGALLAQLVVIGSNPAAGMAFEIGVHGDDAREEPLRPCHAVRAQLLDRLGGRDGVAHGLNELLRLLRLRHLHCVDF